MRERIDLQTGFTLIELVIVVVILGVLAAVALPRFAALTEDAELAQVNGIAGSLKVSVQLVKTAFLTKGYTTRVQNLPGVGSGNIDTNNIGYPIGISKGNGNENIGPGNAGCEGIWTGILSDPPSVSASNDTQSFRAYRHSANRICSYVYRENGDLGNQNTGLLVIRYNSNDGSVIVCGQRADIPAC